MVLWNKSNVTIIVPAAVIKAGHQGERQHIHVVILLLPCGHNSHNVFVNDVGGFQPSAWLVDERWLEYIRHDVKPVFSREANRYMQAATTVSSDVVLLNYRASTIYGALIKQSEIESLSFSTLD